MRKKGKLGKNESLQDMKCIICNNGAVECVDKSTLEEIGICSNCKSVYFKSKENDLNIEVIRYDITKKKQLQVEVEKQLKPHIFSGTTQEKILFYLLAFLAITSSLFINFYSVLVSIGLTIVAYFVFREHLKHKIGMSLCSEKLLIKNVKTLAKRILEGNENVSQYSTSNRYSNNEYFNQKECENFIRRILADCNLVCQDVTIKESWSNYEICLGIKHHNTSNESLIYAIESSINSEIREKRLGIHSYYHYKDYDKFKGEWVYISGLTFQKHLCLDKPCSITGYADMYDENLILNPPQPKEVGDYFLSRRLIT